MSKSMTEAEQDALAKKIAAEVAALIAPTEKLIGRKDLSEFLGGIAVGTIDDLRRKGKFPDPYMVPGSNLRVWKESQLREWITTIVDKATGIESDIDPAFGPREALRKLQAEQEAARIEREAAKAGGEG